MSSDLANRLNAEGHRRLVGRIAERDLLRPALAADEPPLNVLYLFGPGGVGKTTLLREFATICQEAGIPASYVDAHNLEPSPDAFVGTLSSAPLRQIGEIPPSGQGSS
jgi:replication-associated recombination protein RarA